MKDPLWESIVLVALVTLSAAAWLISVAVLGFALAKWLVCP